MHMIAKKIKSNAPKSRSCNTPNRVNKERKKKKKSNIFYKKFEQKEKFPRKSSTLGQNMRKKFEQKEGN